MSVKSESRSVAGGGVLRRYFWSVLSAGGRNRFRGIYRGWTHWYLRHAGYLAGGGRCGGAVHREARPRRATGWTYSTGRRRLHPHPHPPAAARAASRRFRNQVTGGRSVRSRVPDAGHALVEALLGLAEAVLEVPARVYLLVSLVVVVVIVFAAVGPHL